LAPARGREAENGRTEIHGNVFSQYLHTWGWQPSDQQYSLGRIGTRLRMDNLFDQDDGLRLSGELFRRQFETDDSADVVHRARLDRFSYRWGGTEDRPLRLEFGRFLHDEFPEFGVLDGTEVAYRTASGSRLGFSVGFLPQPFDEWKTGEDFQVSVFYRFVYGEDEKFRAGVGYQKTWHQGTPDRDLLVCAVDYVPNPFVFLHGALWGDFYGANDAIESSRFEITQALLQGTVQLRPGTGLGTHFSQIRWPQLLRDETLPVLDRQIQLDYALRYGLSAWHEFSSYVRLDGRVDRWQDQDHRDGTTWDVNVAFRNLLYEQGEVGFGVYNASGLFTTGFGGRVFLAKYFSRGALSLSYDIAGFDFTAQESNSLQHAIHAGVDFNFSTGKSLSLFSDYRFGDDQNALGLGVFYQHCF
jgi:hypothetical protein